MKVLRDTGLTKRCPRCAATGTVHLEVGAKPGPSYTVIWSSKDRPQWGTWRDCWVSAEEIARPTFGCGYDGGDDSVGPHELAEMLRP